MTETPKKISKKMKTQWVEQYTAGEPIKKIAEQDNVSEKAVLEAIEELIPSDVLNELKARNAPLQPETPSEKTDSDIIRETLQKAISDIDAGAQPSISTEGLQSMAKGFAKFK